MAGKPAPYWGAINPPPEVVAQRQGSLRKGSLGNGSTGPNLQKALPTEPYPRAPQPQPQPRPDRYSIQSQAPTESTLSPFASPVESTFRAEGLAPRPPSYQYGGEAYNKESLERRRKRASREKAQQLFEENTGPPPAAPDVPRQGPPSSYRPPQSNGDRYLESEGIRSRRPSEPVERTRQNPEDYYREASQLNKDRGAGRRPLNVDTALNRANTTGNLASRDDNAERSNIRRGSVQARKERPEIRSAVANSQSRRRSSATEAAAQQQYTSERSPLQKLEQTLISKEEKRARMEEAERRAREAKAGRSGQNTVHFGAIQPADARSEPRALPQEREIQRERDTRGLGIIGQDDRQIPSLQESMKPVPVQPPVPIEKDVSFQPKPQLQPHPEPQTETAAPQPDVQPGVQRGRSFRERAGAFLQRSNSNKLKKKDPNPKVPWDALVGKVHDLTKETEVANNSRGHDDQAQRGFSAVPLDSAQTNVGNRGRGAAVLASGAVLGAAALASGGSKRQDRNNLDTEGLSDDDTLDVPKRGNSTRKIEQLMGNKVGTDFRRPMSPQEQQLFADRLDRSEELGPEVNANRKGGLDGEATDVATVNGPRHVVPAAAAAGNYGQEQAATGPDGHHYFSKIVHAGRNRHDPFKPGYGLYAPTERLFEWKTAGVASLTGTLLDVKEPLPKQTEADKDKAWWEAGNTGRRRRSVVKATEAAETHKETKDGPTGFSPRLFLKCGPLLRYAGMKKEKASQRPGSRTAAPAKETWRGSVMIVTEDARSKYDEAVPTLRLFAQPKSLFPPPPRHFKSGADVAPEYVDPLAGQTKVGRDGKTLYVRPVEELEEAIDLSRNESDEGIFEGQRSPSAHADGSAGQVDGEMAGKVATVKGFRLHAERGVTFWRFNIEVELTDKQQRIAYKINNGPATGFWVPALGQSMNMMFHSCNGFSMSVNSDEFSGPDPMWRDVMNTHQTQPFHVMIGGGDQIYNDCVIKQTELFAEWIAIKNPIHKHNASFTPEMQDELEEFYLNRYSMWFSQGLFGLANSQIPMVNIFDDHDIIDGFGSYPHHFMDSPVFSGLGNIAFKYYMLFQHQSSIDEGEDTEPSWLIGDSPGPYIKEHSRSLFMSMGAGISFLGMDCRTERSREDVLSEETYHKIMDRCHDEIVLGETKHLIVLMGVPIAYPRLVWLENILTSRVMDPVKALGRAGLFSGLLNQFDGGVEILDDLDDHWTAKSHKKERQYLIEDLQDLAADKSVRITILGGDVHLAAIGQFYSNPKLGIPKDKDHRYMLNVVSSAIVNTPPPDMMADILNKRNKVHHFDDETDESMIPIFTHDVDGKKRNNNCLLPRRNWCSIRPYNPELSPPSTPSDQRSLSPERPGLLRRLSMTRRPTYRADAPMRNEPSRPPLARGGSGLLRRLSSSRGRPTEPYPGGRPEPPQRTLSLTRDFRPATLFRRLSGRQKKRTTDSGGINGYGSETDSEPPYSSEDIRVPRIRGGAGDDDYFSAKNKGKQPVRSHSSDDDAFSFDESPPLSTAPLPRTRGHERPPPSHRNNSLSERVQSAEAIGSPRVPPLRAFHRTPTGLSQKAIKAGREPREEDAIDLEGGLEITLNVEVNQRDPAGITAPYRLLVPALFFDGGKGGVERKKSVVQRLMGMGREGVGM